MTFQTTGTQYFPQPGYGYGMGYPGAGYPGAGYPTYPTQPGANAGGTDPNAILGAVIQPLMGLVMSLLTGTSTSEQPCPDPGQDPGTADPGVSDATLGPDSETSDYLEVLNENDSELTKLEKKFGNNDGILTEKEVGKILRKIEKGETKGVDVSADLQAALTWLKEDETGQTVMLNLSNEFDVEGGKFGVNVKGGFDEDNIDDVDALADDNIGPSDGEDVIDYLANDSDGQELAKKVGVLNGDGFAGITKDEVDMALKSDKYSVEEKAYLRFLSTHFSDVVHTTYGRDSINHLGSPEELAKQLESDTVASDLREID